MLHDCLALNRIYVLTGLVVALNEEFKRRALSSEGPIDLARASLLVSRLVFTDLDEQPLLTELDKLAARLEARTTGLLDVRAIAETMGEVLCVEQGFRGNSSNYYDPDNSYLNRVLERRTGIPVTLSIVYMEVGRRAGVDVRGIAIPGHFMVAVYRGEGRIFVDQFYRGLFWMKTNAAAGRSFNMEGRLCSARDSCSP